MNGESGSVQADKCLIIVDMQNDFITGALGTKEAQQITERVLEKARAFEGRLIFTQDTHREDYLSTQEGKLLPVEHCIKGTAGWELADGIKEIQMRQNAAVYEKPTFASVKLAQDLADIHAKTPILEIELAGLCTDICVISNAMLLKGYLPEVPIYVDASCCAGVTPQKHEAALDTMESCQVLVRRR